VEIEHQLKISFPTNNYQWMATKPQGMDISLGMSNFSPMNCNIQWWNK
jgi:hypothetical protein